MANNNRIILPPEVMPHDLASVLGVSGIDLMESCLSNANNMWSVGKPVYMAKPETLTDYDLKFGHTVSGYDISYGIKKKIMDFSSFIDSSTGVVNSNPWSWDRPVRDGVNFFRLTDYNHYYHNAECAMYSQLTGKDEISVPTGAEDTGETFNCGFNFRYMSYSDGAIKPSQLFANCQSYYPSVLMTCILDGHIWQYAKSAHKEGTTDQFIAMGDITDDSTRTGATISIDTKDMYDCFKTESPYDYPRCFTNGLTWTITLVMLSQPCFGTTTRYKVNGLTIISMEYMAGADRKNVRIINGKYRYFSSMTAEVKLVKDGEWYRIDYIKFTGQKETADNITFSIRAGFTCRWGMVRVSNYAVDAQGVTVDQYGSATFTGQGSREVNMTPPYPTSFHPTSADYDGKHCTVNFTLKHSTGSWEGSFDFVVDSAAYYVKTTIMR